MSNKTTYSVQEVANMFDVTKMSVYNRINGNDPEGLAESIVKKGNFQRLTQKSIDILSTVWELKPDVQEEVEEKAEELEDEILNMLKEQVKFLKEQIDNKDELLYSIENNYNEQLKEMRLELDIKNKQIENLNTSLDKSLKVADQFQSLNLVQGLKKIDSKDNSKNPEKSKDNLIQVEEKEINRNSPPNKTSEEPAKKGFFASLFNK